jgi:hypothetical protein
MKALTEIISEYETAEAQFEPYRKALRERLQEAIDTYKRVGRERKLYSNWQYGWVHWMGWLNLNDIELHESTIYIEYDKGEYGSGDTSLTFDEIENAEAHALAAADAAIAEHDAQVQSTKEAKRRDLQRQLAELDR